MKLTEEEKLQQMKTKEQINFKYMTAAELYPKSQEEIQDFIRTRRKELNLTSFEMYKLI